MNPYESGAVIDMNAAHKTAPTDAIRAGAEMLYRKRGQRYVPEPELSALAPFDAVEMLICATRYYTGRSTIAASIWADDLARHWASLPKGARTVIKRDLENAFERVNALGDGCDRVMWEKVRDAWMREEAKETSDG